jgi:hypothetical protein
LRVDNDVSSVPKRRTLWFNDISCSVFVVDASCRFNTEVPAFSKWDLAAAPLVLLSAGALVMHRA